MTSSLIQDLLPQGEGIDESSRCGSGVFGGADSRPPLSAPNAALLSQELRGADRLRAAVLLTLCNPRLEQYACLQDASASDWRSLLRWLDVSGLALYFLDCMTELQLRESLPPAVLSRLDQNLIDNTERTRAMIAESASLQQAFQEAHLSYANLKGLSLSPVSVPRPELRLQFDLDFLVAETSAAEARRILESRGYRLYAISGRSLEFKLNQRPGISLKDVYKNLNSYAVELHIEADTSGHAKLLEDIEWRDLGGIRMPVLSPAHLFLGQGLHAYKHVCAEFSRASHLIEFRRHVLARRDDDAFWRKAQEAAQDNRRACLGLGVVTFLITQAMGEFAPEALTHWTVRRLPYAARQWVEMYAPRIVLGNIPGSKLYLLLQRELDTGHVSRRRSLGRTLIPLRLPPLVIKAAPNESVLVRLQRYRMQVAFLFTRLRFHLVEGLRYLWELHRWQKHIDRRTR